MAGGWRPRSGPGRAPVLGRPAAVAVAGLLLAACGSATTAQPSPAGPSGGSGTATGSPAGTASATATGTAGAPPSGDVPPPASGAPSGTPECRMPALSVTGTPTGAAAGHQGVVLLFANAGPGRCLIQGYPGVAGLDGTGQQLAQASRTLRGYLGGLAPPATRPPAVVLAAGQVASALVEATSMPAGGATACPSYTALLVTPPDETHAVRVDHPLPGCSGLSVHPVVPGATGSQQP